MCNHPTCAGGVCRRVKQPKKVTRIKKVSDKRRKQNTVYSQKRNAYLKAYPTCQVGTLSCTIKATEVHHKRGREGELLTDERYFLAVCRHCHTVIEENPTWAKHKGFSENRLD